VVSVSKLTLEFLPKSGPDDVIRISEFLHNAASPHSLPPTIKSDRMFNLFAPLHIPNSTLPSKLSSSLPITLPYSSAYLYQQDKRALPRKLQGSKLFSFPPNNKPLTTPLLLLSSVSLL